MSLLQRSEGPLGMTMGDGNGMMGRGDGNGNWEGGEGGKEVGATGSLAVTAPHLESSGKKQLKHRLLRTPLRPFSRYLRPAWRLGA